MKILFVCTGNTCRSPLAEVLYTHCHPEREARSRGLAAYENAGAAAHAAEVARERGCDLSAHQAHMVAGSDMEWADTVYGMTTAHAAMLRTVFPAFADKVKTLPGGNLPDPIGGTMSDYRDCADRLEKDIAEL
jgi:protein-tyrosine phosphatase